MNARATKRPAPRWIPLPLEPAGPWMTLNALTRTIGCDLFRVSQDRVIAGITLQTAEAWVLRQLSPDPNERKTIRAAVRKIIEAGLLVEVEGGVRLLYCAAAYEHHQATRHLREPVPVPSGDGAPMVTKPSGDGAPMVAQPSGNGHAMVHQPSGNGHATVGAKSAESHTPDLHREREKEKETQREKRVRAPAPEEPVRLSSELEEPAEDPAVNWAAAVQLRFRKLHLEAGKGDPSMRGRAEVALFPERLANTARSLGRDAMELLEEAFAKWLAEGRDGAKKYGPYSAFIARFDNYVSTPEDARGSFLRASKPQEFEAGSSLSDVLGAST
jgi:hypothetical protein